MTDRTKIGGNNPPGPIDPIETVMAEFDDLLTEAQNWTDGEAVSNKTALDQVDQLIKQAKAFKSAIAKAGKERTAPLHAAWKSEVAAVKVYADDAQRILDALIATGAPFRKKLADEQKAAERAAWEAANKARLEAEEQARKANAADLDAQRDLDAKRQAAIDAEKDAKRQQAQKVKGFRKTPKCEVEDSRAAAAWIFVNDRAAMDSFVAEYARRNMRESKLDGVRYWVEEVPA